ncbi:hypothetical protein ETD86_07095 [Nonomuraea turkmeniaca]|uniref:Condensation domain-containing protein n=1 Tax=Nonomuraea turkmeniaca TaxID=103838 RepID=A0A5S4FUE7_9ACTN|nr:condensation domain-containing protein [Nonomuraea turkmeniaca]TMR23751.1 hypothetical protein ETD86_07095 [Nonomuraea turkmeniaca]
MSEVSFIQHGIWINEQLGAGTAYRMPIVITFAAAPEPAALAKAIDQLVERHPMLGSAIEERDGVLHLVPAARRPALGASYELDIDTGPLITFTLNGRTLTIVAHHVIFDGASKEILVDDLAAFLDGTPPPPLAAHDHAAGLRQRVAARLEAAKEFWASRWREPQEIVVAGKTVRGRRFSAGHEHRFSLEVPRVPGLTRFEVFVAALHTLLHEYGNAEIVTAIDLSTRSVAEEGHVGPFVNEVPLFSSLDGPFENLAAGLRAELRQLYRFREVPLARAVPRIRPHASLAPISVSYRHGGRQPPWGNVEWLTFNGAVRGALQLQLLDAPDGLLAGLRYSQEADDVAEIFSRDLAEVLGRVAAVSPGELPAFTEISDKSTG